MIHRNIGRAQLIYNEIFTDQLVAKEIISIFNEFINGKYDAATKIDVLFSLGELKSIQGFWCCEPIVKRVIDVFQARALRQCCHVVGIDMDEPSNINPSLVEIVNWTNVQRDRIYNDVQDRLKQRFGDVAVGQQALLKLNKLMTSRMKEVFGPTCVNDFLTSYPSLH